MFEFGEIGIVLYCKVIFVSNIVSNIIVVQIVSAGMEVVVFGNGDLFWGF